MDFSQTMDGSNNIENSIFDLADINMNLNEDYNDFYQRFRNIINCHLIKRSAVKRKYPDIDEFLEDEIISPTFGNVIIVWCLQKIDVKLPYLCKQAFNHKLVHQITLKDLQKEIFKNIPELLSKKDALIKDEIKSSIEDNFKQKKIEKDLSDWKEEEIEVKYEEEALDLVEESLSMETAELISENSQAYTRRKSGRNVKKQDKVQAYKLNEHIAADYCKNGELEYKDVRLRNKPIIDYNEEDKTNNELTDNNDSRKIKKTALSQKQDLTTER